MKEAQFSNIDNGSALKHGNSLSFLVVLLSNTLNICDARQMFFFSTNFDKNSALGFPFTGEDMKVIVSFFGKQITDRTEAKHTIYN